MNDKMVKLLGNAVNVALVIASVCVGKACYHKGKMDAYKDVSKRLEKSIEDVEDYFAKKEKEES